MKLKRLSKLIVATHDLGYNLDIFRSENRDIYESLIKVYEELDSLTVSLKKNKEMKKKYGIQVHKLSELIVDIHRNSRVSIAVRDANYDIKNALSKLRVE